MRLELNDTQCRAVGAIAARLPCEAGHFLPPPPAGVAVDDDTEALFWMVATGICQQTRTLDGTIAGRRLRGSDYLISALRQHLGAHLDRWSAKALTTWTVDELRGSVSDAGDPSTSTLDREKERLRLLQSIGLHIAREWGGKAMLLFTGSNRRVESLLARLAPMEAYSDPVAKKSLLLLNFLNELGLWPLADRESLDVAVDYHIMRVAMRIGLVEIKDELLRRRLVDGGEVDAATDNALRLAVRDACRRVLKVTPGLASFHLDNLLWMIGRNCCFYEHPPVCTKPGQCWKRDTCSLLGVFPHDCGLSCPMESICLGAKSEAHRALRETNIDTHFY